MYCQIYQQIELTNGVYFSMIIFPSLFCTSWVSPVQLKQNACAEEQGGWEKAEILLG